MASSRIDPTCQPAFIVFQYSAANQTIPSNNRFRFQRAIVKANRVRESMCNVFVPIFFLRWLFNAAVNIERWLIG
jgi:hypothetical protein